MAAAVVLLVLFLPAAAIYGRHRARHLKQRRATLGGRLAALLPMPALLAVCGAVAIAHESGRSLATGNGVIDAVLTLARWIGELELILFMVAGPYLIGVLIAAVLLALDARGLLTLAAPVPADGAPGAAAAKDPSP